MGSTSEEVNIEQLKLLKSIFEVRRTPVRQGKEPQHATHARVDATVKAKQRLILVICRDLISHMRG